EVGGGGGAVVGVCSGGRSSCVFVSLEGSGCEPFEPLGRGGVGRGTKRCPEFVGGSMRISGASSAASPALSPFATGGIGRTKTAVAHGKARAFRSAQPPIARIAMHKRAICTV